MTEREDAVSRRYHELPAEEPPRALDEAILAASRRAVHTHPAPLVAPAGRQRWTVPLAAAAVIVLAVGLTLRVQMERPETEERVQTQDVTPPQPTVLKDETPKAEGQRAQPKVESRAFREDKPKAAEPARQAAPEARAREKLEESQARGAAGAPSPFPSQAPAVASAPPPPAPAAKPALRADDSGDRAEAHALASGVTAKRQMAAEETPERMLERIFELRKNGKHDEADKALAEFRKRFPDYKLSEEMRAKVERPAATPAR